MEVGSGAQLMLLHRPNQRAPHIISPCHNTLPLEVKQTLTFLAFCLSKITKSLQFRLVSNYASVSFMRQSCFMRSCDNSSTTLSHRVSQKNFLKDSLIIGPVITRSEQPKISHGEGDHGLHISGSSDHVMTSPFWQ